MDKIAYEELRNLYSSRRMKWIEHAVRM